MGATGECDALIFHGRLKRHADLREAGAMRYLAGDDPGLAEPVRPVRQNADHPSAQQRQFEQILRPARLTRTAQKPRAADRKRVFGEQLFLIQALPVAGAKTNGDINAVFGPGAQAHQFLGGGDPHINVRMLAVEMAQARYQPLEGDGLQHGHMQGV